MADTQEALRMLTPLTGHLLCARPFARLWIHGEQDRQGPCAQLEETEQTSKQGCVRTTFAKRSYEAAVRRRDTSRMVQCGRHLGESWLSGGEGEGDG